MKLIHLGLLAGALILSGGCAGSGRVTPDEQIDALAGLDASSDSPIEARKTLEILTDREREENRREILRSVTDPVLPPSETPQTA